MDIDEQVDYIIKLLRSDNYNNMVSASLIQRRMKMGFNKALALLQELEARGIQKDNVMLINLDFTPANIGMDSSNGNTATLQLIHKGGAVLELWYTDDASPDHYFLGFPLPQVIDDMQVHREQLKDLIKVAVANEALLDCFDLGEVGISRQEGGVEYCFPKEKFNKIFNI